MGCIMNTDAKAAAVGWRTKPHSTTLGLHETAVTVSPRACTILCTSPSSFINTQLGQVQMHWIHVSSSELEFLLYALTHHVTLCNVLSLFVLLSFSL